MEGAEVLSREQLKKVMGGEWGSEDGGSTKCADRKCVKVNFPNANESGTCSISRPSGALPGVCTCSISGGTGCASTNPGGS